MAAVAGVPNPEFPVDLFGRHLQTLENMQGWMLPFGSWMLNKRLSVINHVSRLTFLWTLLRGWRWWIPSIERFRELTDQAQRAAAKDASPPPAQ